MRRFSKILLVIGFLLSTSVVFAQYRSNGQSTSNTANFGVTTPSTMGLGLPFRLSGLLDASKLQMHHQFSTGYTSGGSGNTLSGLYLNTMTYQVNQNYQWIFALGYGGTAMNSMPNGQIGGIPVGMIGLQWKPMKNMLISASVGRNVGLDGYNSFGYSPWNPMIDRDVIESPFR